MLYYFICIIPTFFITAEKIGLRRVSMAYCYFLELPLTLVIGVHLQQKQHTRRSNAAVRLDLLPALSFLCSSKTPK
jgi:hypothetical protein